jgi:NADH-quinone oxidoreductase subunit H
MKFALFFMAEYIKMIAVSAIAASLFFGGYLGPDLSFIPVIGPVINSWIGPVYLLIKILLLLFGMIWVRATLPRMRYDRLMAFGWKILFPLALINVLITAVGVVLEMFVIIPILTILSLIIVLFFAGKAVGRR